MTETTNLKLKTYTTADDASKYVANYIDDTSANFDKIDAFAKTDTTLTKSGGIADAKVTGDKISDLTSATDTFNSQLNTTNTNVTNLSNRVASAETNITSLKNTKIDKPATSDNGKTPRAKDGNVEWVEVGLPSDEQTATAVSNWLDAHPEATTTVQDGSITESKINSEFYPYIKNDYVTPEMFGAIGDGTTDDTEAVKAALQYSIQNKVPLKIIKKNYVTSSLVSQENGQKTDLNIVGISPKNHWIYVLDNYGGIRFKSGINLFEGGSFSGSISNLAIVPTSRTQTGSIFNNCSLSSLRFDNCTVANVLAFCNDCGFGSCTRITSNIFLTVYYFAKRTEKEFVGCTDSTIFGNYINGGAELNNNGCFQFGSYNGTNIASNFIDYYRTIYDDTSPNTHFMQGPNSNGNQYQVFKYFLLAPHSSVASFTSTSDCFNWTKPSSLQKLADFEAITYTTQDGETRDMPPFVARALSTSRLSFKNAIVQSNMGNLIFIEDGSGIYEFFRFDCDFVDVNKFDYDSYVTENKTIYTNGEYQYAVANINFIQKVDSLPTIGGWMAGGYLGKRVLYNGDVYRLLKDSGAVKWVKVYDY